MVRGLCEALECRRLFTTYLVNTLTDSEDDRLGVSDGRLSLREALIASSLDAAWGDAAAGESSQVDTIKFAPGLRGRTITTETGNYQISGDTILDGGGVTLKGTGPGFPIIQVLFGTNTVQNLTVRDAQGGAMAINAGETLIRNLTFRNNTSTEGGAIHASVAGTITVRNSRFIGNSATEPNAGTGGAISHSGTNLDIYNSTFRNNSAINGGGAISTTATSLVTIRNSTFTGNRVTTVAMAGGAIFNDGGEVNLLNSKLSNNEAAFDVVNLSDGGAIKSTAGQISVRNSVLNNNQAGAGGAIDVDAGSLGIHDSRLAFNFARYGGAVQAGIGSSIMVMSSTIANNTAQHMAGGLYSGSDLLYVYASRITGNKVADTNGNAGGIYVSDGTTQILRTTIANNRAVRGGGIDTGFSVLSIEDSSVIRGNRASQGGGVFVAGTATISNSRIAGNVANQPGGNPAGTGGGIANFGTLNLSNVAITDNRASTSGGGIYLSVGSTIQKVNVSFARNTPNDEEQAA